MATTANRTITDLIDEHLDTWSEPDPARRLERIQSIWEADGGIVDPPLDGHGHEGINALMGTMQTHYPEHRVVRTSEVDAHHDTFRVAWGLSGPAGDLALTGIDVGLLSEDGRVQRIVGFFGELAR
jgi:hypothetical protein